MCHSFKEAGRGIGYVFKHEQNFRLQFVLAILVVLVGWLLKLSKAEWIVVLLLICLIMILEFLNSAVEKFADILRPRLDPQVQLVKEIMAGVVLLASLLAVLIGVIIFYPHIVDFLKFWW